MKISLLWLNEFIDIKDYLATPDRLAQVLTSAGLEVEGIENKAKFLKFVVVGQILEKGVHPNANKLSLCKVTTGNGVVHQIVCGAQNHKANDKVVVALPGAELPGGMVIQKASLRGVDSEGMLCSKTELGMAESAEEAKIKGIFILPPDAALGTPIADYLGVNDILFDVKVTPNRADTLSHFGLARELSVLLRREIKSQVPQISALGGSSQQWILTQVQTPLCLRYMGRGIRNVQIKPSPDWLRQRIENLGIKSINNVVDVTNFVMFEFGQPLHAFDAKEIHGQKILVREAKPQEKFISLDGSEFSLFGGEVLITDHDRIVALGGVVGGKNSGVSNTTTDLFLEAACFSPAAVRRTSRTHGIETDSSYRFSRGVDPHQTGLALDRATQLILEVAGGQAMSDPFDHNPTPEPKKSVQLDVSSFSQKLGFACQSSILEKQLASLKCQIKAKGENSFTVVPPSFRFDLESEVDFIEEYARLEGYDKIPENLPTLKNFVPLADDEWFGFSSRIRSQLQSCGFSESINLIFDSQKKSGEILGDISSWQTSGLPMSPQPVMLENPLGSDQDCLRRSLIPSLLKNVSYNFHQSNFSGALFELGKVFNQSGEDQVPEEIWHLGMVHWGQLENMWQRQPMPNPFAIKSALLAMTAQLQKDFGFKMIEPSQVPQIFHKGQFAQILLEKEPVGVLGSVHPQWLDEEKVRTPVALAVLNLHKFRKLSGGIAKKKFQSIGKFPVVHRDFALVMSKKISADQLLHEIAATAGPTLKRQFIFDSYEGDKIAQGKKSLAVRLAFQSSTGTLTEEVLTKLQADILKSLKDKLDVSLR